MPSQLPRIAITVPEDLKAVLAYTASQTGQPVSKLILDLLQEAKPQVLALGEAIEASKKDPLKGTKLLQRMLEGAKETAAEAQIDLDDAIEEQKIKARRVARKKATK